MNFDWLSDIINSLLSLIPRPIIVRATHGGVKWTLGNRVKELKPGYHCYWPLIEELDRIVTARQTYKIPKPQAVTTIDDVTVAVCALVVYSINDIIKAIGRMNWDVDTTLSDILESAVLKIINKYPYHYLRSNLELVENELTEIVKKELLKYGVLVQQARFTDFAKTEVKMLLGLEGNNSIITEG